MNAPSRPLIALALTALIMVGGFLTGCEIDSANSLERTVGVDFTGVYANGGANIIRNVNRPVIRSLDLRQNGDRLQAIDDQGGVWNGSIGDTQGETVTTTPDGTNQTPTTTSTTPNRADFELIGTTGDAGAGRFSGYLAVEGGETVMSGTYIAGSFYASFKATKGEPIDFRSPKIVASQTTLTTNNPTANLSVNGGVAPYSWTVSPSGRGNFNTMIGSSVVWTRSSTGMVTITVTDSESSSDSISINQPP